VENAVTAVDPERLLKDLRKLWLDLAQESPDGVLRACAMTLIVVADERRDAQIIGETIAGLMHEHPSRAIVIRVRGCEESVLEARVFAQCWMPFGRRQQICCEQVEIIASPASLADVATVIRALIVPDLPAILYSPSENLWWLPQFQSLLPLAGKLIIDSCAMEDSTRVFGLLTSLPAHVRRKADLVWSRLTPWREAIAQVFEHPKRARSVYDLSEIRILYKGTEEPSSVYYLAGWFMHLLGAGVPIRIARGVGPEYAGIAHVSMSGEEIKAEIGIIERCTAEIVVGEEAPQLTVFPVANEAWALHQELGIATRDVVFEDATGLANLMRGAA
jgi:glucose-6-phosphate dehydrogenase assembly protein OpcA